MISALRGKVFSKDDESIVVDVNGVGYEVTVSAATSAEFGRIDSEISLLVFTDVKENAITLYGFRTQLERRVFLLLRKVKGIGSRTALNILSGIGPEQLLLSIGRSDVDALKRIPGIGKKTSERVIVELRETVGELVAGQSSLASEIEKESLPSGNLPGTGAANDALLALEKLGFTGERARKAIEIATTNGKSLDAGEILRRSLAHL